MSAARITTVAGTVLLVAEGEVANFIIPTDEVNCRVSGLTVVGKKDGYKLLGSGSRDTDIDTEVGEGPLVSRRNAIFEDGTIVQPLTEEELVQEKIFGSHGGREVRK